MKSHTSSVTDNSFPQLPCIYTYLYKNGKNDKVSVHNNPDSNFCHTDKSKFHLSLRNFLISVDLKNSEK